MSAFSRSPLVQRQKAGQDGGRTPCSARSSLESGADMMTRRTEDGAAKWALCALRDEMETTAVLTDRRNHRG